MLDICIAGAGRHQEPDAAWRPNNRPQAALANALVPLFPAQPNGDPYPSLVLEVGNSQSIPDLISIRDRMLSWRTAINILVLVAYNRNSSRTADSWFVDDECGRFSKGDTRAEFGIEFCSRCFFQRV